MDVHDRIIAPRTLRILIRLFTFLTLAQVAFTDDSEIEELVNRSLRHRMELAAEIYHNQWESDLKTNTKKLKENQATEEVQTTKGFHQAIDQAIEELSFFYLRINEATVEIEKNALIRATQILKQTLSPEDITLLLQFARSEIGKHFETVKHPHDKNDPEHLYFPEDERLLLQKIKERALLKKFRTVRRKMSDFFIEQVDIIFSEIRSKYIQEIEIIFDRLDPNHFFSESIDPSRDSKTINLLIGPSPPVREYMNQNGIEEDSLQLDQKNPIRRIGDQITILVSYGNGTLEKQWLVQLESVQKNEAETERYQEKARAVYHTSLGNRREFSSEIEATRITIIGPFNPNSDTLKKDPHVSTTRTMLKTDFLELGLNIYCELICRIVDITNSEDPSQPWSYSSRHKPYSQDTIESTQASMARFTVSDREDRALAGSWLALWEFLQVCNRTQGLRNILTKVIKLPPPMSMLANGFETRYNFEYGSSERYHRLPEYAPKVIESLYSFPLILYIYEKPALKIRLFPTEPLPPLHLTSGFYGLVASTPDKPEKRIVLRVIAGKRGPVPATENPSNNPTL